MTLARTISLKFALLCFGSLIGCATRTNVSGGSLSYDKTHFVEVTTIIAKAQVELRYSTSHNFIGRPVKGYLADKCLLTREAAFALLKVEKELEKDHLSLHIYDCYRPQKAVNDFMSWSKDPNDQLTKKEFYPDVDKARVFELGYVSSQSGHTRGSTIDLTIAPIDNPTAPLDMGTSYDFFSDLSATDNPLITGIARTNRERLKNLMQSNGFKNYEKEWWHYTLKDEPYPNTYFDFDIEL